jgi:hypothetical protein
MRGLIQKIAWMVAVALSAGLMAAAASAGAPQAKTKKTKQPAKQEQPKDQADEPADQQKPADQQPQDQPSKPLFTGKVKLTSSRQGKGTATAGFNGVGPDGKVKEALLNANPSADARAKAAQLTLLEADASEVQAFAKEGKLNPPAAKTVDKKGK